MSEFDVGTVVQLKSGGPAMTVKQSPLLVNNKPVPGKIVCTWFVNDELKEERFSVGTLKLFS